jgi:hypothetical protein
MDFLNIIGKYVDDKSWETPLSLAVFGPPGTGKSFTVKAISKAAGLSAALEYNLAQFTTPKT